MKLSYLTLNERDEEEFRTIYIDLEKIVGWGDLPMDSEDEFKLICLFLPTCVNVKYSQELVDYLLGCGRFV